MSKLYLFPICCFALFQITFVGTYIAAVIQGHVVPDVPYISDAATYSPESCVFGQLISFGVILLGLTIYIRYRQLLLLCERFQSFNDRAKGHIIISYYIGLGSCLGISLVGNFQETNVRVVHYIGAFLCFGLGTIYFWFQTWLSYILQPYVYVSKWIIHMRLVLTVLCTIFYFEVAICGIISHTLFNGSNPRKWFPSDGGWAYHVASSIGEWIVATMFCFYIITFTDEFKFIGFDHPPFRILEYDAMAPVHSGSDENADDANLLHHPRSIIAQEI